MFDTLLMAFGIPVTYAASPPSNGVWLLYAPTRDPAADGRCLWIFHSSESWSFFKGKVDAAAAQLVEGLPIVLPDRTASGTAERDIEFDIIANAFYFLTSWSERVASAETPTRRMYANSVFVRLRVPQDVVDQYLRLIVSRLRRTCDRACFAQWQPLGWPSGADFALVLSHDVDFIPTGLADTLKQGVKTAVRHLFRQRDVADAITSMAGLARALLTGRDAYGRVPELIAEEVRLGVRASFQVAVGHRHPEDVNYRIQDDRVRDYLRAIRDAGFDLCLHGSYRSSEDPAWYAEEVALLSERLGRPVGSRQHFLSFNYDGLFAAQERTGICFDMSMGFPDRTGPRAGFSYPYFPYSLAEDRPYDVVEISLFLMDVTLRGYMGLKGSRAWQVIETTINELCQKRGCASAVWHPIVFGGARDPGYDRLFWAMIDKVRESRGVTADGTTINSFWRDRARTYASFSGALGRCPSNTEGRRSLEET